MFELITVYPGPIIEGAYFWRPSMRFGLRKDLSICSEWDWKGVTTAAYGWSCEKSRNPLIHHSYSTGIILYLWLFFCFYVPLCIRLSSVCFQSLLLFSYEGCYLCFNVASGQQACCKKHLVYNYIHLALWYLKSVWQRINSRPLLRYPAWSVDASHLCLSVVLLYNWEEEHLKMCSHFSHLIAPEKRGFKSWVIPL